MSNSGTRGSARGKGSHTQHNFSGRKARPGADSAGIHSNAGGRTPIGSNLDQTEWVNVPTIIRNGEQKIANSSLSIDVNSLIDRHNPQIFSPSGRYGAGLASQLLADAPYFFTDPFHQPSKTEGPLGEQGGVSPLYNLTHYYAHPQHARSYLLNNVLQPLLNPRCTFHERFALEVYRQDACRRFVEEVKAAGYFIPPSDPKSPQFDQYAIVLSLRSKLLAAVSSEAASLMNHYKHVVGFATSELHIPGACYLQERNTRGSKKVGGFEDKFIQFLSSSLDRMRTAEQAFESVRAEKGPHVFSAYIDMIVSQSIGLPCALGSSLMGAAEDLSPTDSPGEIVCSGKEEVSFCELKHTLVNQVGFFSHYKRDAAKGDPVGYRDSPDVGAVHRGQLLKGDLVAVAMKGWFNLKDVLGPRTDRRARRDLMRSRGELRPIFDPDAVGVPEPEVSDSNAHQGDSTAEPNAGDPSHNSEFSTVNIHRKMMYFHTTVIDPTLAVSATLPLPSKTVNVRDLDSPSAAVLYLRKLRKAEHSMALLNSSIVSLRKSDGIVEFTKFSDKLRSFGVDEIGKRIKDFDVRLGGVHAKEGAANETRVWKENIPRIIKQILLPRYGDSVMRVLDSRCQPHNLGSDHFGAPLQAFELDVEVELRAFVDSVAGEEPLLRATAFWAAKCQSMCLTDAEVSEVRADPRFVRYSSYLESLPDSFICEHYRTRTTIPPSDMQTRENVLVMEANPDMAHAGCEQRSEEASSVRAGLLKYLAFWIFCDRLNSELRGSHKSPLPFFHFVTVNTKYCVNADAENWSHVGEFDGLLLDLRDKAPQLLHIFEIKANPADLTSAWKQRERFLNTLWAAFCRRSSGSFTCPLHQIWYSVHGLPCPEQGDATSLAMDPMQVGTAALHCSQITPGEVSIYPAAVGGVKLPVFYQLIFPLLSFNVGHLLGHSPYTDDLGCSLKLPHSALAALKLRKSSTEKQNELLPPVHPEVYTRMLGMWVFASFIIVDQKGVPIIPQWRLQGMGSFRHLLCSGAAAIYSAGRLDASRIESWEDATLPTGTVGTILAAKRAHSGSDVQVVGPWLRDVTVSSPHSLLLPNRFALPEKSFSVFSLVFYNSVKHQVSKITKTILCPQELVSELSRNGFLSSLLLIPKIEAETVVSIAV